MILWLPCGIGVGVIICCPYVNVSRGGGKMSFLIKSEWHECLLRKSCVIRLSEAQIHHVRSTHTHMHTHTYLSVMCDFVVAPYIGTHELLSANFITHVRNVKCYSKQHSRVQASTYLQQETSQRSKYMSSSSSSSRRKGRS